MAHKLWPSGWVTVLRRNILRLLGQYISLKWVKQRKVKRREVGRNRMEYSWGNEVICPLNQNCAFYFPRTTFHKNEHFDIPFIVMEVKCLLFFFWCISLYFLQSVFCISQRLHHLRCWPWRWWANGLNSPMWLVMRRCRLRRELPIRISAPTLGFEVFFSWRTLRVVISSPCSRNFSPCTQSVKQVCKEQFLSYTIVLHKGCLSCYVLNISLHDCVLLITFFRNDR